MELSLNFIIRSNIVVPMTSLSLILILGSFYVYIFIETEVVSHTSPPLIKVFVSKESCGFGIRSTFILFK